MNDSNIAVFSYKKRKGKQYYTAKSDIKTVTQKLAAVYRSSISQKILHYFCTRHDTEEYRIDRMECMDVMHAIDRDRSIHSFRRVLIRLLHYLTAHRCGGSTPDRSPIGYHFAPFAASLRDSRVSDNSR